MSNIPPKVRNKDLPHFEIVVMDYIRRMAAQHHFRDFLGPNPPKRPKDLPANSSDKNVYHRLQLQSRFDEQNGKFIQALADVTTGTGYEADVSRYLTDQRPLRALEILREKLLADSGHTKQKLFDTYFASFRFDPSVTTPSQFLSRAVSLIDTANASMIAGVPLPPNHHPGDPHPDSLPSKKKAEYLRILLTPIDCFRDIFLAGQCTSTTYNHLIDDITRAIENFNTTAAYRQPQSAHAAREEMAVNEVDTLAAPVHASNRIHPSQQPIGSPPDSHRQRRHDSYRSTFRSATPHPSSHSNHDSDDRNDRGRSFHRRSRSRDRHRSPSYDRHDRRDRHRSHSSHRSYGSHRSRSPHHSYRSHSRDRHYRDRSRDRPYHRRSRSHSPFNPYRPHHYAHSSYAPVPYGYAPVPFPSYPPQPSFPPPLNPHPAFPFSPTQTK